MSSATVLFVLARILAGKLEEPSAVAAMAFGPGLTIEAALFEAVPVRSTLNEADTEILALCQ
jgi:predicted naringenin-chalcone synthase